MCQRSEPELGAVRSPAARLIVPPPAPALPRRPPPPRRGLGPDVQHYLCRRVPPLAALLPPPHRSTDHRFTLLAVSIDALDVAFAGVVIAGLGLFLTALNARSDRRHAKELAHGERLFVRRGDVYVDLLASVYERMELIDRLYLLVEKGSPAPDEVDIHRTPQGQMRLLQARLIACRSRTVAEAWDRVVEQTREFLVKAETLRTLHERGAGKFLIADEYKKLGTVRDELWERVHFLEDRIADELTRRLEP
jgi:hypothetical protein